MNDISSYPPWVRTGIEQISALLQMALEQGLTPSFTLTDVLDLIDADDGELACLRRVALFHKIIHDLLYASPKV